MAFAPAFTVGQAVVKGDGISLNSIKGKIVIVRIFNLRRLG